ncbi:TonB-dependent receptor [Sphingomonas rhizophila]|nr:TonB-dependent receptor [Sphingomonas rhizophila]
MNFTSNTLRRRLPAILLGSTILMSGSALAQDATSTTPVPSPTAPAAAQDDPNTVIVTATRREENLQDVPIAITAITTKTLDDLQVNQFEDYAKLVPSLSFRSGGSGGSASGPGTTNVYFRGVASGENGNHSASLPSVGTYLDEQPITTISGALDVHVFDIARIEALAGPQGTLYGASSQAGTVRIITNKPDTRSTYGEANLELNKVAHGGWGYSGEAFVNSPLSDSAAIRAVGWYRRDAGYIDNIAGTLTFPTSGITIDNDDLAEEDYNDVKTYGGRVALRAELNENWTVTPSLMGQKQIANGSFAEERGLGELETMQFNPERTDDRWLQAALTIEGKLGNFDVTYAGSLLRRRVDSEVDYADYGYFYDALYGYGSYFYDNDDNLVSPNQYIQAIDRYRKMSQELRFTSPSDKPIRLVGGLFYQRQKHNIRQDYIIDDIADPLVVAGTESDIWLTQQLRVDRDYAAFGELTYDVTPTLSVTAGGRFYKYDNSLVGFFGYSDGYSSGTGVAACFGPARVEGSPCTNVDKRTKDSGFIHRLNATWTPNADTLFYATWSRGFRPGGINRRGTLPPYQPDYITNYEAGTKLTLDGGRIRLNAAVYQLDWDDIQLSFLGANGLTEIRNAGNARIRGAEFDFYYRPMAGLTFNAGAAVNYGKLTKDFCKIANDAFDCTIDADLDGSGVAGDQDNEINETLAPAGTRLPMTARFKGSARARYEWNVSDMKAHVQLAASHEGSRTRDVRTFAQPIYGRMDAYTEVDASTGLKFGPWTTELYVKNLFDSRGVTSKALQCAEGTCGDPDGVTAIGGKVYSTVIRPRTIGLRFGRTF